MKRHLLFFLLVIALFSYCCPAAADEALIWTNFNTDPVKNGPQDFPEFTFPDNSDPVRVTKIRTYHWNSGDGAVPGMISVTEDGQKVGTWQASGQSAYGTDNVYWEVSVDFTVSGGHSYMISVSDPASMSYNAASGNRGMAELYGEGKASASQPSAAQKSSSAAVRTPFTTVKIGRYEQDGNFYNGSEVIEWQVLAEEKDRILVISKDILDYRYFAENQYQYLSKWENGSIRKWLNDNFFYTAFNEAERSRILLTSIENPANSKYGTSGGNKTQDRIFLLSIDEANRYFKADIDRTAKPTSYALSNGFIYATGSADPVSWMLRSPGADDNKSAVVTESGSVSYEGQDNFSNGVPSIYAMRPAFWMKNAAGFTVTYEGNNCLAKVPTDNNVYMPGETVTVLFDPVEYMSGLIFNGWDWNGDGSADFGYYYNTFPMPNKNVVLKAICYVPYSQDRDDYHQIIDQQQPIWPDNNLWNPGWITYDGVG